MSIYQKATVGFLIVAIGFEMVLVAASLLYLRAGSLSFVLVVLTGIFTCAGILHQVHHEYNVHKK